MNEPREVQLKAEGTFKVPADMPDGAVDAFKDLLYEAMENTVSTMAMAMGYGWELGKVELAHHEFMEDEDVPPHEFESLSLEEVFACKVCGDYFFSEQVARESHAGNAREAADLE